MKREIERQRGKLQELENKKISKEEILQEIKYNGIEQGLAIRERTYMTALPP